MSFVGECRNTIRVVEDDRHLTDIHGHADSTEDREGGLRVDRACVEQAMYLGDVKDRSTTGESDWLEGAIDTQMQVQLRRNAKLVSSLR